MFVYIKCGLFAVAASGGVWDLLERQVLEVSAIIDLI
jgi:hypothetical protein